VRRPTTNTDRRHDVTLNSLADEIYNISKSKGFWPGSGRDPAEVLMLIVTEAAEAMEAIRDGCPLDEMQYGGGTANKPIGLPSEMADIIIRTLDACAAWGIDIDAAVREKIEYNATRPAMHGRVR
jgi:hypothetical protein